MLGRLRARLTYANVVATLALFVALGTGGAYAANTVFSSDIVDGEVKSVDIGNNEIGSADVKDQTLNTFDVHSFLGVDVIDGTLTGADLADGSIGITQIGSQAVASEEVLNDSLTASDINEASLAHCPSGTVLFGRLCANDAGGGGSNLAPLNQAANACIFLGLRLPTWAEATRLAVSHDVPGVITPELFWTDEVIDWNTSDPDQPRMMVVNESGASQPLPASTNARIVCVEIPTTL